MSVSAHRTRIKICGVTSPAGIEAAVAAGADAVGFVLAEGSPRRIDARQVAKLRALVPPFVTVVAVQRNADAATLRSWPQNDLLQLHGDEREEQIAALGRPVIRGFAFSPEAVARWDDCAEVTALLVDGPRGGTGQAFDHAALAALRATLRTPVILAGGLSPDNVGAAILAIRPYAVDVSSGVEESPGVKDPALIDAFCRAVRAADKAIAKGL